MKDEFEIKVGAEVDDEYPVVLWTVEALFVGLFFGFVIGRMV